MKTLLIIIGILAVVDLLIIGGCLKASGKCSDDERKRDLGD